MPLSRKPLVMSGTILFATIRGYNAVISWVEDRYAAKSYKVQESSSQYVVQNADSADIKKRGLDI